MPTFPVGFVSDISSNATDMIASLSPVVTLILGVLLAALVIGIVINALKR